MVRLFLAIFTAPSSYRISAKQKMKYCGERQEEAPYYRNKGDVISVYFIIYVDNTGVQDKKEMWLVSLLHS